MSEEEKKLKFSWGSAVKGLIVGLAIGLVYVLSALIVKHDSIAVLVVYILPLLAFIPAVGTAVYAKSGYSGYIGMAVGASAAVLLLSGLLPWLLLMFAVILPGLSITEVRRRRINGIEGIAEPMLLYMVGMLFALFIYERFTGESAAETMSRLLLGVFESGTEALEAIGYSSETLTGLFPTELQLKNMMWYMFPSVEAYAAIILGISGLFIGNVLGRCLHGETMLFRQFRTWRLPRFTVAVFSLLLGGSYVLYMAGIDDCYPVFWLVESLFGFVLYIMGLSCMAEIFFRRKMRRGLANVLTVLIGVLCCGNFLGSVLRMVGFLDAVLHLRERNRDKFEIDRVNGEQVIRMNGKIVGRVDEAEDEVKAEEESNVEIKHKHFKFIDITVVRDNREPGDDNTEENENNDNVNNDEEDNEDK